MKHLLAIIFISTIASLAYSQENITVRYHFDFSVTLNDLKLTSKTKLKEIVAILGEPTIYKSYPTGKVIYHYKEKGMVIHTVGEKLLAVGVNYNWDGDQNFPSTTYEGNLFLGEVALAAATKDLIFDELQLLYHYR